MRRGIPALVIGSLLYPAGAAAQEHDMAHMGAADSSAMTMTGPLGLPHARMGSGTSWVPDATPMQALHWKAGSWTLMLHGQAYLLYNYQATRRGDTQVAGTNWGMLMAMHPLAGGLLHLHGMLSLEPFTVGKRGYPLLLQSGESVDGEPLHDRQHPHDLFMELATMYERPVGRNLALSLYLAPVGEPAVGPVAFMHRPSGMEDPMATLAHHWQDATHITFGVATVGVYSRTWKLEGSVFNGREPDEDRTDFDFRPLDSYGGRLTINPSPHLALSAWYGFLESPEGLEAEISQDRIGASLLFHRASGSREWSAGIVYGANHPSDRSGFQHSMLVESTLRMSQRSSLFGRLSWVQKSGHDLEVPGVAPGQDFNVTTLTLGGNRDLFILGGTSVGLGGRGSVSVIPAGLEPSYGTRTPAGVAVYLRLVPGRVMP
jgi:hypothetical protein